MNIQEVLKLENDTIVQDIVRERRYIVRDHIRGGKYLIEYKYRNEFTYTMSSEELLKIVCPITTILIQAEYRIIPNFKEKENFIYENEDGKFYRGIIMKDRDYSYEVVIVTDDEIKQINIVESDMWRMYKRNIDK